MLPEVAKNHLERLQSYIDNQKHAQQEELEVKFWEHDRPMDIDDLKEHASEASILLSQLSDPISRDFIEGCPLLKLISQFAVGYNNIDVQACVENKILVTHTPVLSDACAEHAIGLLLATSRLILNAHVFIGSNRWLNFSPNLLLGKQIKGSVVGIFGAGRIGTACIKRLVPFEPSKIVYCAQAPKSHLDEIGCEFKTLDDLLPIVDFLILTCPLTPNTKHILNEDTLTRIKKNALIVNIARGPVIDEGALVHALKSGHLWGAGLDVFETEPDVHPHLLECQNVVFTPHIASATIETRSDMFGLCVTAIINMLEGDDIDHLIPECK
ncbi:hypothetical protein PCE1_001870 [Barthelona sp. PCE]